LDTGSVVICNVHNGGHWVLATGYSGDTIYVNDPGFSTTSYTLNEIVNGQNAVYKVTASFEERVREVKNTARGILANLISVLED
jgi:ABC-type bacteriocin/lantibiotic exporter with double-glycine peptidase domain